MKLDQLRALLAAGTARPWRAGRPDMLSVDNDDGAYYKRIYTPIDDDRINVKTLEPVADSQLIAAAVNHLDALLALAEAVQLAEAEMTKLMGDHHAPAYRGMDLIRAVQPLLRGSLAALEAIP